MKYLFILLIQVLGVTALMPQFLQPRKKIFPLVDGKNSLIGIFFGVILTTTMDVTSANAIESGVFSTTQVVAATGSGGRVGGRSSMGSIRGNTISKSMGSGSRSYRTTSFSSTTKKATMRPIPSSVKAYTSSSSFDFGYGPYGYGYGFRPYYGFGYGYDNPYGYSYYSGSGAKNSKIRYERKFRKQKLKETKRKLEKAKQRMKIAEQKFEKAKRAEAMTH